MNEPISTGESSDAADAGPLPRAFGSFALLKSLSRGARGEVFAALRPVEIERFCALKILRPETTRQPEVVNALRSEATRLVRRIHGNLVQLYDVGLVDQRLFFVSELVEGASLEAVSAELARKRRPFPVDVAVFVAMELAAALSYLRRLAARHGDGDPMRGGLAPRAVLLSTDGEVKLLHYGATVAALAPHETSTPPRGLPVSSFSAASADPRLLATLLRTMLGAAATPLASSSGKTPPPLPAGASAVPPALTQLLDRCFAMTGAPVDADEVRASLATILRTLKPGATPAVGELVRSAAPPTLVDRAALAALAKSWDPKRGASPPTW
jgi:serine/threonine protein kinase